MSKIVRLTESDLIRLVNKVINEQNDLSSKGFQKWGTGGYLMRLPKGSNNTNDAIRITADLEGDKYNVIVSVQSNKKVRAEIKGNNVFKKIESILGNKFSMDSKRPWENTSGVVDSNTLDKIVNLLSSLKVDEKNNIFTESDLIRLVKRVIEEQSSDTLIKIYDDKGETKVLGGVSIKGSPKKVGFDKKKLEILGNIVDTNTQGILRVDCVSKPTKFYFYDKNDKVVISGFNSKFDQAWCEPIRYGSNKI